MPDDQSTPLPSRYYTTHQIGRMLGVTASSVVKWVNDGLLTAFTTPGNHRRIPAAELVRFSVKHGMPIPEELRALAVSKVLFVDDDPGILQAIRGTFRRHDDEFQLETAGNGVDALMLLGSFKPDLLVLDVRMPGLDGFDVLARLKSNPATRAMAVVAISGDAKPATRARCEKLGADVFLAKPFEVPELLKTLRELRKPHPAWSR